MESLGLSGSEPGSPSSQQGDLESDQETEALASTSQPVRQNRSFRQGVKRFALRCFAPAMEEQGLAKGSGIGKPNRPLLHDSAYLDAQSKAAEAHPASSTTSSLFVEPDASVSASQLASKPRDVPAVSSSRRTTSESGSRRLFHHDSAYNSSSPPDP